MNNLIKNKFNFYKNIFIALIVLCAMSMFPKQMRSLEQERQREAQREGIEEIDLKEVESKKASDLYTQTQAHEHVREMRELIQKNFGNKVVPYFNIISRMVTKEAELKDTHYVFYHAAPSITAVQADLFTQLYIDKHPEAANMDEEFRFLRFRGESKDMSVQEFVAKQMRETGLIDDSGKLGAILLSVNLSLFGNVGSRTESTWLYFIENERENPKQDILEKMMNDFGLTKKYINEIMALDDIIATPEATMLQIFIPKEIVDEIVYLAWIRGIPATGPIMEWIKKYQSSKGVSLSHTSASREKLAETFKKEKERNPMFKKFMQDLEAGKFSAYAFLRAYCNMPNDVPYLNDTEGRILFTKEGLLNPASGIKFCRYFTTSHKKLEEYTTKLNAIVQKLLSEKTGQKVEDLKPIPQPTAKSTPMPKPSSPVMPKKAAPMPKPIIPIQGPKPVRSVQK